MPDLLVYLPDLLLGYAAFLLSIASPGPNILAIFGTSMAIGRGSGIALAFGIAIGSLTLSTLTVIGLTTVIASYAGILVFIKIFGGLYLLWLAYKAFRLATSDSDIEAKALDGDHRTPKDYFWRGYLVQITNPKAALAWIAICSLALSDDAPIWIGVMLVLGTFFLSITIHVLYAVAFSTPIMLRTYLYARRAIQATLGVFFAFAGIKLLISRT